MKKLIIIGAVFAAAVTHAGTTVITVTTNASGGITFSTNAPTMPTGNPIGGLIVKGELVLQSLGSATNWGFSAYGTYGSKSVLVNGHHERAYGGGFIGIYDLNAFIGIGGGLDYIGGLDKKGALTVVNANFQLQLPLQPLEFTGWGWATNFTATPFVYQATGTPLSGTGGASSIVIHEGEGINLDLVVFGNWTLGFGVAYIQRQNAGIYSGNYWNGFIDLHRPF